ncbi:tRNA 5-(aminomethyl)-2-thiouridylate-methyltransferase MnmM [Desulfocurvus sp. DL9XJH121]
MLVSHTITFVKALLGLVLRPGDMAVDATAGNGIDTLFLSRAVGPGGRVFAFDVQAQALESTRARLGRENAPDNVTLIHAGHEDLARELPPVAHGALGVVAFNLGYLPGGDPGVATHAATTCAAVDAALPLMRQGGLISLVLYTGHPGGPEEARAVEAHCAAIPQDTARVMHCTMHNQPSAQVRLLLLEKQ